jgi:hypothetical protein
LLLKRTFAASHTTKEDAALVPQMATSQPNAPLAVAAAHSTPPPPITAASVNAGMIQVSFVRSVGRRRVSLRALFGCIKRSFDSCL